MIEIDIAVADPRWSVLEASFIEGITRAALERQLKASDLSPDHHSYEVCLLLTTDAEVKALNGQWRGHDRATNVLSFPSDEMPLGPNVADDDATGEVGPPILLGDVCLAYETVASEAEARGLSLKERTAHLLVHGLLHLFGFTHDSDTEADSMEATEDAILKEFGLCANRE